MLFESFLDLPVGPLRLIASDKGLSAVIFSNHKEGKISLPEGIKAGLQHPMLTLANKQLEEYFSGQRTVFEIPLDPLGGTNFQRQVWLTLQKIPFGNTVSYAYQAEMLLGNKNATRAVALANSKNPLSIVVPCHRVIGTDGKLRGYAGGLETKIFLLEMEKMHSTFPPVPFS